MALRLEKVKCPVCGVEFVPPTTHGEVVCPNGHVFNIGDVEENSVLDCEIRDWESSPCCHCLCKTPFLR